MMHTDSRQFPLTHSYLRYLRKFSYDNRVQYDYCVQEAYTVEWELRKRTKQIKTYQEKLKYFRRVLCRRLVKMLSLERAVVSHSGDSISLSMPKGIDFTDVLIQVRPFDEYFHEQLILHLKFMIGQIDSVAAMIFSARLEHEMNWHELYKSYFKKMPRWLFYENVTLVKKIVFTELVAAA